MIERIITGGQTGVEQAAWASARRSGIATGGYMPRGFDTESGPEPRLGLLYGATEFPFDDGQRVRANLRRADALLWLGDPLAEDARTLLAACRDLNKPHFTAQPGSTAVADILAWIRVFDVKRLMISGSPPSRAPRLAALAAPFLDRLMNTLARASDPS